MKETTKKKIKARKPPVIRKGQKKPFVKATNEEIADRVEFTARLLVKQLAKGEIRKVIVPKFNVDWRTADVYIGRARAYLMKQAEMTSDEAKAKGVNVLLDVFRTGKPGERVSAERRWSEIFGYNAPTVVRDSRHGSETVITGSQGIAALTVIVTGAVTPQVKPDGSE